MACNNVLIDQLSTQLNQRIMKMIIIVLHTAKCKYIVHLDIILVSDWILSRLKSSDPMNFLFSEGPILLIFYCSYDMEGKLLHAKPGKMPAINT